MNLSDVSELYPHQVTDAGVMLTALKRFGATLNASGTGTGKTRTAVAVARELQTKPLVVCPKAVLNAWHREAEAMGGEVFAVNYERLIHKNEWGNLELPSGYAEQAALVLDMKKALKAVDSEDRATIFKNGERLKEEEKRLRYLKARRHFVWDKEKVHLLVFDECHKMKGERSLNGKMGVAARRQNIPTIMLSATAAQNPLDMWALGYILRLHSGTDFWNWCRKHGCVQSTWGGMEFRGGAGTLKRIHSYIYPERGVRTTIEDLGSAFPESQILAELYDLEDGGTIDKLYAEMKEPLEKLATLSQSDADLEHPLTLMLRARQKVELLKVPVFESLTVDAVDEGMSVAIFVNFDETINQLLFRFPGAGVIRGGQTSEQRTKVVDDFQNGRIRVVIANQKAGGVGISLHDIFGNFPRLSLISPTFSAIDLIQTIGRVWRAGAKSKSLQRIVLAAGTVEEKIHKRIKQKLHNISLLNDGDMNPLDL